jgi:hypothetical protein
MSDHTEFQPHTINNAEIANRGWGMAPSGVSDDGKIVGFFYKAVLNRAKSTSVPVHDNVVCVRIQNPGERDYIERKAREEDFNRWPRQYHAFTQGRKFVSEGTPLELLFPDQPNIVATLNAVNIHTVQQLANLSGDAISRGGIGFQDWVTKAKKYLESAEKGVNFQKFEAEKTKWEQERASLQKQISDLATQLQQVVQKQTGMGMPQQQYAPQPPMPPQNYDHQSSMIANTMQADFSGQVMTPADFSHDVQPNPNTPVKRRGRPAGSKNKTKETTNG